MRPRDTAPSQGLPTLFGRQPRLAVPEQIALDRHYGDQVIAPGHMERSRPVLAGMITPWDVKVA